MNRHPGYSFWRSTTALTAVLSLALPTLATAQATSPVVPMPPGQEAAQGGEAGGDGAMSQAAASDAAAGEAAPDAKPAKKKPKNQTKEKAPRLVPGDDAKGAETKGAKAEPHQTQAETPSAAELGAALSKDRPATDQQPEKKPVAAEAPPKKAAKGDQGGAAKDGAKAEGAKASNAVKPEEKPAPKTENTQASEQKPQPEAAPENAPQAADQNAPAQKPAQKPAMSEQGKAAAPATKPATTDKGEPAQAAGSGEANPDADALAKALAKKAGASEKPATKPATAEATKAGDGTAAGAAAGAAATTNEATKATPDAAGLAAALAEKQGKPTKTKAEAQAEMEKTEEATTGAAEAPKPAEITGADAKALDKALSEAATANEASSETATKDEATAAAPQSAQEKAAAQREKQNAGSGNQAASETASDEGADNAAARAAAGSAPVAAALAAPATLSDDATAVDITKESARSSNEDFVTSIAAAAKKAANANGNEDRRDLQRRATENAKTAQSDDDDDNSLRSILIGGLAGLAVGSILGNNDRVALNSGDRVVLVAPDGSQQILKNDDALLLRPGAQVTNETFDDGSSRSIVTREDGSRVVTIRDAQLRVLRRTLITPNGQAIELIDDAAQVAPVIVRDLPPAARPLSISPTNASVDELRQALEQEANISRRFSLAQIRDIARVRSLVAPISIDSITFDTGSAAINPDQAQQLSALGETLAGMIKADPREIFLIEGYTDTVGAADMNLALSDRRAESLALALTEYFHVPPENMVVQGYGERFLAVEKEGDVRANRRVAVRRITDLLQQ